VLGGAEPGARSVELFSADRCSPPPRPAAGGPAPPQPDRAVSTWLPVPRVRAGAGQAVLSCADARHPSIDRRVEEQSPGCCAITDRSPVASRLLKAARLYAGDKPPACCLACARGLRHSGGLRAPSAPPCGTALRVQRRQAMRVAGAPQGPWRRPGWQTAPSTVLSPESSSVRSVRSSRPRRPMPTMLGGSR